VTTLERIFKRYYVFPMGARFVVTDQARVDRLGNYKVVARFPTMAEAERSAAARQRSFERRMTVCGEVQHVA